MGKIVYAFVYAIYPFFILPKLDMKRFALSLIVLFLFLNNSIQAQDFAANLISDSLTENAHAVIRNLTVNYNLTAVNKGTKKVYRVTTVLNRNGDDAVILYLPFDKDSKVTVNKARIYDKNGKLVKKIPNSEIADIPMYDGLLFSDNRMIYYKPTYAEYPYTVEYEYEYSYENLISYGAFFPITDSQLSAENVDFYFSCPANVSYTKKELNLSNSSIIKNENNRIIETWKFNNIKAIEEEPFSVSYKDMLSIIYLMPTQYVYDEHSGNVTNWNEYGKWVYKLYEGRSIIADKEKVIVDDVLGNAKTTLDTIRLLYEYMQSRTRYINVSLGIGGYQPYSAQSVYENGYGDCKALSNYMHTLLLYAGIQSYITLVSAGTYPEPNYTDFPNFSTFNHAILCVPNKGDTIWLECTSQIKPFGFLGDFTDDRDVLLLTPEGGKWAHTKQYKAEDNARICKAQFEIDSLGMAKVNLQTQYVGLQYDNDMLGLIHINADDQQKWLYKHISLPGLNINSFSIENKKAIMPQAILHMNAESRNYGTFTGNYMILPLNKLEIQAPISKMMKKRKYDFRLDRPSVDYDTVTFSIPSGYVIGSVPEDKTINSDFGNYSYAIKVNGNVITYCRRYELKAGRFKANEYKKFYDFVLAVSKADNVKVMLNKK
jgi:hypothetical protein